MHFDTKLTHKNAGVTLANITFTISGKNVIVTFNNISMKSLDDTV